MSSLHNLLAKIGSILQNIIQFCILLNKTFFYSLEKEKTFCRFFKNYVVYVLIVVLKVENIKNKGSDEDCFNDC